ncbi:hypothetical protein JVU11DRAFT_1207 [Chiua virens]|nr:hypothetical protein JVU11DRAFT_1207 [Chiua virens]
MSSVGKDRDRVVATLNAQIAQWKRADGDQSEEIIALRNKLNELQCDLAASTNQMAEEQRRHAMESADLTSEVEHWRRSDAAKVQELVNAREQFAQLQQVNHTSSSRITELDQKNQMLSAAVDSLRAQYDAALSYGEERDHTVANLSAEIEQWKLADIARGEELTVNEKLYAKETAELVLKLEEWERSDVSKTQELSMACERIEQLEQRMERRITLWSLLKNRSSAWKLADSAKAEDLIIARKDLERHTALDRTVAKLNAQIEQWKGVDTGKAEERIALRKKLNQLGRDLAESVDQIAKDEQSHATESAELMSRVEEWKHSYATKADELAVARQQLEQLHNDLSASSSLVSELHRRCEILSAELTSLREELTIATAKTEELSVAHKDLDRVRLDVANGKHHVEESAKELASALREINQLSTELDSLRDRFRFTSSSVEEKDHIITTLNSDIEEWQVKYTAQTEEFVTTRNDLEQLRRGLIMDQQRHAMETKKLDAQVEEWKRIDAAKAEKLSAARQDLEQLRSDLAAAVTQVANGQQRHATESAELISELEELKRLNNTKAQDLAAAREKIASVESQQSTSSSRIVELEQHDESRSVELSSLREQVAAMSSVGGDRDPGDKVEEIIALRNKRNELQCDLAASMNQIAEEQRRRVMESADLTSKVEQWRRSDVAKTQELVDAREQFAQLQQVNYTSSSRITELDQKNQTLSAAVDSLRAQYDAASSYGEEGDHTVASLSAEIEQWKLADVTKGEELTVVRNELNQVRHVLSTSLTQIQENEKLYTTESVDRALEERERSNISKTRELSSTYKSIQQCNEAQSIQLHSLQEQIAAISSLSEGKDHTAATCSEQIERRKLADGAQAEELIVARKDFERLRQEVAILQHSDVDEGKKLSFAYERIQKHSETRSMQLSSLREKLQAMISRSGNKDRIVTELHVQIGKWKRVGELKAEELIALRQQLHGLRRDLSASVDRIAKDQQRHAAGLQQCGETLSAELTILRGDLKVVSSNRDEKDLVIARLTTDIEEWTRLATAKTEELDVARRDPPPASS